MKRLAVLLFVCLLALSLCACGAAPEAPAAPAEAAQAEAPAEPEPAASETAEPEPAAPETAEPDDAEAAADLLALAETFVGRPVSELIAAIGEPLATDYAPSCLGPGQDGELTYDGFTVYTYREGENETVEEVYHAS